MSPADLRLVADHLWQSSLFAGAAGLLALALRKNRARLRHWLWLIASVKFLIPLSVIFTLGGQLAWRTAPTNAPRGLSDVMQQVSAIRESGSHGASLAAGLTCSKPGSGSFVGHLGMRFRRYRLLVVDSVAAHPYDGSQCFTLAVGDTDSGKILACPSRAGCFRDLPACSVVAGRHLRAIDAGAIAGRHHTRALPRPLSG
jgi:hypothetical protein